MHLRRQLASKGQGQGALRQIPPRCPRSNARDLTAAAATGSVPKKAAAVPMDTLERQVFSACSSVTRKPER